MDSRAASWLLADYLLQTASAASLQLVTRLFRRALVDEIVASRDTDRDEGRLFDLLVAETGGARSSSDSYCREHAPAHALAAGRLEEVVHDAGFLVGVSPPSLVSAVRSAWAPQDLTDPTAIYEVAAPFLADEPGDNAVYLELIAATQGSRGLAGG